jgi:hypothetical protein
MVFTASIGLRCAQITLPLQMFLSHRLWWPGADRTFPIVGWLDWPHAVHGGISTFIAIIFVAAAAGWLSPQRWAWLSLLGWALAASCDINRCQPWVWMWVLLALGQLGTTSRYPALWLLPAMYAWSGFHKFSPWSADVFTDFYQAFAWTRPLVYWPLAAYLPTMMECAIAVLLLRNHTRIWGAVLATALHLYIIVLLSPMGLDWNAVVVPWNFAMIALVWAFHSATSVERTSLYSPVFVAMIGLALIGPVLNYWGLWPETFSWKMYSNTQPEATLSYEKGIPPCPNMAVIWRKKAQQNRHLLLDDWAMDNLGTPPFNHLQLYQTIARRVRNCADDPNAVELHWLVVEPWRKGEVEGVEVGF